MGPILVAAALALAAAAVGLWSVASAARRTFDSRLASADAEVRRLADAAVWREDGTKEVRREVSAFREALNEMQAREEERRAREEDGWAVLHRVASVLAGSQRAGRVGENVLRAALADLPPAMVVTDFRVNGKVVEFGLVLPDGRRLPVDSKWTAERELEDLARTSDPAERDRLARVVEKAVVERAREVASYLDDGVTAPVGVAAVPDAAYQLLRRAHAEAYRQGIIVVPYSMALPVLLFLYGIVCRYGTAGDVQACLTDLAATVDAMETTLENKVARAATMLVNGEQDLRRQVGKARSALARARDAEASPEDTEPARLVGLS